MEQALLILLFCSIIIIIILGVILNKRNKVLEKTVLDKHKLEVLRKDEIKEYFKEEWSKEKEKRLASGMLPDILLKRDTLPRTGSGKIDRLALRREAEREHLIP